MDIDKISNYWLLESDEDYKVARHLYKKGDYSYSLFFCHLSIEKLMKSIYVCKTGEQAPYIHNLNKLAEKIGLQMTEEHKEDLVRISAFNLESRYPDEDRVFRNKCTKKYTKNEFKRIEGIIKWLKSIK